MHTKKEEPSVSYSFASSLGSEHHSGFYSLSTIDANRDYKEKGWVYELTSKLKLKWKKKYSCDIQLLHDNALKLGIEKYSSVLMGLGTVFPKTRIQYNTEFTISDVHHEATNISFSLFSPVKKNSDISFVWSWQMWPEYEINENYYISLSSKTDLLSKKIFSLSLTPSINHTKTKSEVSERIAIAYVSGVVDADTGQTVFYLDKDYTVPVTPVDNRQSIRSSYKDFPMSLFDSLDSTERWISIKGTPNSYWQTGTAFSSNLFMKEKWRIGFSTQLFIKGYLEKYKWTEFPVIFDNPSGNVSPVKDEDGYWVSGYNLDKKFIVYKNREDGLYYYRDRNNIYQQNAGMYHRLNLVINETTRRDWGFSLPVVFSFMLNKKILFDFTYTYSIQKSNLPADAPIVAGYNDHGADLQINLFL